MNAVQTAPSRHLHPPSLAERAERPARRVGLVDRLALRLGLALIMWGRRPARAAVASERYITPSELAELQNARHSDYHLLTLIR
jgi:hypothetical protein